MGSTWIRRIAAAAGRRETGVVGPRVTHGNPSRSVAGTRRAL